jgi:hypothetical protein
MKKTATKRVKKAAAQIPQDAAELSILIASTIQDQTTREAAIAKRDALLAKVRERIEKKHGFDSTIQAAELRISRALEMLEFWAVTHKKEFGDARSITRAGARLGWRLGNWQLPASGKAATKAVEYLQGVVTRGGLEGASDKQKARALLAASFLRIKTTLDKEHAISERENRKARALLKGAGLEFAQDETFFLDPEREGQKPPLLVVDSKEGGSK